MLSAPLASRSLALAIAALLAPFTAAADQTVQVGPGLSFSPATVTVAPGETVTWQFQEFHTSTSDSQSAAESWDSGFLSSGSFSHTFNTPGTYPYYCQVHSVPGGTAMNGVVQVSGVGATATQTLTATATATQTLTATALPTVTPTATSTAPVASTATPTVTATPPVPPTSTLTPAAGPGPAAVPDLGAGGRILLALALAGIGVAVLIFSSGR